MTLLGSDFYIAGLVACPCWHFARLVVCSKPLAYVSVYLHVDVHVLFADGFFILQPAVCCMALYLLLLPLLLLLTVVPRVLRGVLVARSARWLKEAAAADPSGTSYKRLVSVMEELLPQLAAL